MLDTENEAVSKINYSLKISSLIALPCTVGLFVLAQPIFNMLFPNAPEGALLLQIECWMLFFSVIDQTLVGALQGIGKMIVPGISLLVGAVVKCVLNVIFIPIYGEVVPAVTSIIYIGIACIIAAVVLYRNLREKMPIRETIVKPAIASAIMGVFTYLSYYLANKVLGNTLSTIISIGISVVVYVIAVLVLRILNKEELEQLPYGNKICKMLKI